MRYIGSHLEPVIEERRETIDAQLAYLVRGTITVVMIPAGSSYMPATPTSMDCIDIAGLIRGAGRYIFDPRRISANAVIEHVYSGNHGALLGHLFRKNHAGRVVSARTVDGTTIQDSAVPSEWPAVAGQYAEMHKRFPDAIISLRNAELVIQERIA